MKANRAPRARLHARDEQAGAEVVGALILFGIFVTTIAILNVTAVPNAGLAAEEAHFDRALSALNGLQSEAETAAIPGNLGATVARSLDLAPARSVGQDLFSYFMATPARASGELTFEPAYGGLSVWHYRQAPPGRLDDIGTETAPLPLGRVTFDPHPVFRGEGTVRLENGAVVTTGPSTSVMRYDPPVSVSVEGDTTYVAMRARILNGTAASVGGNAPVRALLTTEAATLTSPLSNNAQNVTMRIETAHGEAWREHLDRISVAAGLAVGAQYHAGLAAGAGPGGLDVVTWHVNGTSTGNDVRLTTGLAVYRVTLS